MSEPYFPSSRRGRPAASSEPAPDRARAASPEPAAEPAGTVVRRPAEPVDDAAQRAGAGKLSADEVRALLAVHAVNRPAPWKRAAKRGAAALLPVGAASIVFDLVLGSYGVVATLLLLVASLVWAARPLFRDRDWG